MPLEPLICPQCGARIEVDGNMHSFYCTYCGTRLAGHRSTYGVLSATIMASIKEDTSLLAKKEALAHLKQQLTELLDPDSGWRATALVEYHKRLKEIHELPSNRGFFRSSMTSPLHKEKMAQLDFWVEDTQLKYDTLISELRAKIATLTEEVNQLARNA
ncbi:MAG: TFIIB-type zinc ribbon-containing protein [Anaerolineae bacterium]